jgi:hypothetical protein
MKDAEAVDDAGEAKLPNKDATIRSTSNLELGFVRTQTRLQINYRLFGNVSDSQRNLSLDVTLWPRVFKAKTRLS